MLFQNRTEIVSRCLEVGINYVDACTEDEVIAYGKALQGRREKMYMSFDMWPRCPRNKQYCNATELLALLDEGMKKAKIDYVDVWRLVASTPGEHSPADEEEFIKAFDVAKKAGKARFTGCSSHGRPWLTRLANTYPEHFQVLLFPYTTNTKELPQDSLFDAVRKHDIGTLGIKPFAGGSLFALAKNAKEKSDLARMTIRWILGNPAITAPIPGLASTEEVDNMALADQGAPRSEPRGAVRAGPHQSARVGEPSPAVPVAEGLGIRMTPTRAVAVSQGDIPPGSPMHCAGGAAAKAVAPRGVWPSVFRLLVGASGMLLIEQGLAAFLAAAVLRIVPRDGQGVRELARVASCRQPERRSSRLCRLPSAQQRRPNHTSGGESLAQRQRHQPCIWSASMMQQKTGNVCWRHCPRNAVCIAMPI